MVLPAAGVPADEIFSRLDQLQRDDVKWRDGRAFTLVYNAGPDVVAIAEEAYRRFGAENALNTDAFPSLRRIQADVVDIVASWLEAGPDGAGFMTSGGTESILMAVKASRERGRTERNIGRPNVVLPASAHAAFEKGCYYFGLESRRVPVRADWRADVDAMAAAIDDNTVLVVGSAPQYPQGVVDPIPEIAALAAARDINCHVDACMGGVTLTYLARLGHTDLRGSVTPWNFAVDGVTSMSVDLHKYGYTAKGASVVMYRNKHLRRHQTFVTDNWLGGTYGSSGVMGTKSGGPMAAAWAVMNHLGDDGYLRLTAAARRACLELAAAVERIDGLSVLAPPDTTLFAVSATQHDTIPDIDVPDIDVFAVADGLWRRGWYVDRQGPPSSLHFTVNAIHDGKIPEFVADLRATVADVRSTSRTGAAGAYGTVE